jgi:hypothetical protein
MSHLPNIQPGTLVLNEENQPPMQWTMGVIEQVFPRTDNCPGGNSTMQLDYPETSHSQTCSLASTLICCVRNLLHIQCF